MKLVYIYFIENLKISQIILIFKKEIVFRSQMVREYRQSHAHCNHFRFSKAKVTGKFLTLCIKVSKRAISIDLFGLLLRISLGLLAMMMIGLAQHEYLNQRTETVVKVEP